MTVTISSAVKGLFSFLIGLDLNLVSDIYPEICLFLLVFQFCMISFFHQSCIFIEFSFKYFFVLSE